jgi:hypothetical protein
VLQGGFRTWQNTEAHDGLEIIVSSEEIRFAA